MSAAERSNPPGPPADTREQAAAAEQVGAGKQAGATEQTSAGEQAGATEQTSAGERSGAPDGHPAGSETERLYQPRLDRVVLARLLGYAHPYRGRIAGAILLLLLVAGLELLFPLLTRRAIDTYITGRDLYGLGVLSLLYLGLLVAIFALRYLQLVLTQATGQRITTDLRDSLFAHLQGLDQAWFERNPVGRIMTRLTGDVEALNDLFTSGLVSIFGDIVTLFGIAGVLFWLNPRLALVALTVVPLLLTVTLLFRARVRTAYALIRVRIAAINAYLQESIAGISLVQLFHREEIHEAKFAGLNAAHRDAFLRSVFYYSVYFPVVELLESLALALILWYGGIVSLRGALTLGSLVAFIQYAERFFRPIRDLSERYNILQGAMASSERIFDLLDTKPGITAGATGASGRAGSGDAPPAPAVEFQNVRFSYVPGEEVLKGLSFTVRRGESVALVGQTGAGKTTVSTLLSRFRDVDDGAVLVDGRDVRAWDLGGLRRRVALVPQEAFLWTGDIRLNVALRAGRPEARVAEAIRLTGLETLAGRFAAVPGNDRAGDGHEGDGSRPDGVGERGSQLSSGERQLVSIARALAADPPILVLDEATSNVDTETEQRIRAALRELLRGRTSLVIAHRLSTIRFVNRILVLHHGLLVETGTHDELLRRGGIYARYYELEYRGQEATS
jgi:ATP-binding cassette subfamily B protein